jgi:hypothetical protein
MIITASSVWECGSRDAFITRFIFRHDGANKIINIQDDRKFYGLSEYIIIF